MYIRAGNDYAKSTRNQPMPAFSTVRVTPRLPLAQYALSEIRNAAVDTPVGVSLRNRQKIKFSNDTRVMPFYIASVHYTRRRTPMFLPPRGYRARVIFSNRYFPRDFPAEIKLAFTRCSISL